MCVSLHPPLNPPQPHTHKPVADLGVARPFPPHGPKMFSIPGSFSKNLAKLYVGTLLEGWRPLLLGILDHP